MSDKKKTGQIQQKRLSLSQLRIEVSNPKQAKHCRKLFPTVGFFGSIINVPGFTLGVANQPSYLKEIPRPGEILNFEDLTLTFMVDEGLQNYLEIGYG